MSKLEWNRIVCGDCLELMKQLPDGCVDELATDPPYGYSFMGKDWDRAVPKVEVWKECLRVMKPGAFGFILCAPRQDCLSRMIVNLEDAGFWVNFSSIYWAYASGFPKAQNISKTIDKAIGRYKYFQLFREKLNQARKDKGYSIEDINQHFSFTRASHLFSNSQPQILTRDQWNEIKKWWNINDDEMEKVFERAEREVIQKKRIQRNSESWETKSGMLATGEQNFDITAPATPQAKALDGSYAGFQPKPAVEVVICVMKPLSEKTFVDQALKNGKGVTWLGEGRIPYESQGDKYKYPHGGQGKHANPMDWDKPADRIKPQSSNPKGRFPANLLVQDDVLNDGKIIKADKGGMTKFGGIFGSGGEVKSNAIYFDSGSFSRYFDLDRWFTEKIKQLPESVQKTFPFLVVPKASKAEKNRGLGNTTRQQVTDGRSIPPDYPSQRGKTHRHNIHPTVKPLKLMCYLIMLGSRVGDVVLDPYIGSGTTALGCQVLNRRFLGFDNEQAYVDIANERLRQEVFEL